MGIVEPWDFFFFFFFFFLAALGLCCSIQDLSLGACMQDLVPQPGIEPQPPALALSLTHWTTREVQAMGF